MLREREHGTVTICYHSTRHLGECEYCIRLDTTSHVPPGARWMTFLARKAVMAGLSAQYPLLGRKEVWDDRRACESAATECHTDLHTLPIHT